MTSFIHESKLTPSDMARLGNNLPRRRHRSRLPQFWHTDPIRRSLAVHEPNLVSEFIDACNGEPELSDCLA